jgi:hypothetical protein
MKRNHYGFLALALISINTPSLAGGLIGDAIEGLCGNCGAGRSLDDAHRGIKEAVPPYGAIEEGVTHLGKEATVETAGPALAQWIRQSRNDAARAGTSPIPPEIRNALAGFFPDSILNSVSYRVGVGHELSLQNNSFEFGDAAAITLEDIIVFKSNNDAQNNPHLWAHELGHVQQYKQWGLLDFAKKYVRGYQSVERGAEATANNWSRWASSRQRPQQYGYSAPSSRPVTCYATTAYGGSLYWTHYTSQQAAQAVLQACISRGGIGCRVTHCN